MIRYILTIFFILSAISIEAMPPHPDLDKKLKEEGQTWIDTRAKAPEDFLVSESKSTPQKAAVLQGTSLTTIRVPVLLVLYGTSYGSSNDIYSHLKIDKYKFQNVLMIVTITLLLLFGIKKINIKLKPAFTFLAITTIGLFSSCGVEDSNNELDFPTDISLYDRMLNGTDNFTLSARKYFSDMSNGNLTVHFDFYGPVRVSKPWYYYGENTGAPGTDAHPGELVSEAIRLMVAKYSSTDFSIYDSNKDKKVDAIIVIHEGPGEEFVGDPETIWSHEYDLNSAKVIYNDGYGPIYTDGVYFNTYTTVPEYNSTRGESTIGVFCHELGHALGLPDLYDTSNQTYGVGDFSLMGTGSWGGTPAGSLPAPLLAWERYYLGGSNWITVTELTSSLNDKEIKNIEESREAFKIMLDNTAGQNQYLILEGKKASSSTEWYVPGTGILITHIHEGVITKHLSSNQVNYTSSRIHGVNIKEASGNDLWSKTNKGNGADLYTSGGISNIPKYTDNITYTLSTTATTKSISDIQVGATMTFDYTP
ncbi:MAG TPA: M6 family metalloprotease domain-containing protein [Spirochaetota bacterium]|nr:M6 family metalloprotease domain-containing protein [Spirochaetota bacterium]